ncbi:MAG TPA: TetR/AcrR family transcriptional regulator [Reyranella sp.]|nr:TetR/AcrR family transcriptional regulator [Reyranella sp.]
MSTASVGTRKRRGEGHTRRDEILSAARELFLRDGYEATTIRRIADVVGVSAPALYLYFKDKDAIMLALCDQTFRSLNEVMDDMEKQQLPPLDKLRRCGRAYIRFALEHPRQYWLTFMSGNTPAEIKKRGHKPDIAGLDPNEPGAQGAIAFARLMGIFREIETSGHALNYPVDTAAELVWMCLHGLVAAIINNPEFPWTRRDVLVDGMLDVAMRGVVKLPQ